MGKFLRLTNGVPRSFDESGSSAIYEETYDVMAGIPGGTPVTLPSSGTYNSTELQLFLNGQRLDPLTDYSYVGSVPRTQISFTFELFIGDKILFYIERNF